MWKRLGRRLGHKPVLTVVSEMSRRKMGSCFCSRWDAIFCSGWDGQGDGLWQFKTVSGFKSPQLLKEPGESKQRDLRAPSGHIWEGQLGCSHRAQKQRWVRVRTWYEKAQVYYSTVNLFITSIGYRGELMLKGFDSPLSKCQTDRQANKQKPEKELCSDKPIHPNPTDMKCCWSQTWGHLQLTEGFDIYSPV